MACSCTLVAAAVIRGDLRKRLADPLGPAAAVADVVAGAAVAVAAAAAPRRHRSPFVPSPQHISLITLTFTSRIT